MDIQAQRLFLENLWHLDQDLRHEIMRREYVDIEAPEYRDLVAKGEVQDIQNRQQLRSFVEKNGWPRLSVHGERACEAAFLVVQHSEANEMAFFMPFLQEAVVRDDYSLVYAAMLEDRYLLNTQKPQIYGSQAWRKNMHDPFYVIWPVKNPSDVNERRLVKGFVHTIEEYAAILGAQYLPQLTVEDLIE